MLMTFSKRLYVDLGHSWRWNIIFITLCQYTSSGTTLTIFFDTPIIFFHSLFYNNISLISLFNVLIHLCGTLTRWSINFCTDFTSEMSAERLFSLITALRVLIYCLIISLADLIFNPGSQGVSTLVDLHVNLAFIFFPILCGHVVIGNLILYLFSHIIIWPFLWCNPNFSLIPQSEWTHMQAFLS